MSEISKRQLGDRIRQARRDANLTQADLAEKIGVSQGVISNVENGVSTIDAPDLPQWAEALKKPIMYFYLYESLDVEQRMMSVLAMFEKDEQNLLIDLLEALAVKRGRKSQILSNGTGLPR